MEGMSTTLNGGENEVNTFLITGVVTFSRLDHKCIHVFNQSLHVFKYQIGVSANKDIYVGISIAYI